MSKNLFTKEQQEQLRKNKYVKRVSQKAITYEDEFKRLFMEKKLDGESTYDIFVEAGFDPLVLGDIRLKQAACRWQRAYDNNGMEGLRDGRKDNSGRPRKDGSNVKSKKKN